MFMLNALDDPLIPERLFEAPKKIVGKYWVIY